MQLELTQQSSKVLELFCDGVHLAAKIALIEKTESPDLAVLTTRLAITALQPAFTKTTTLPANNILTAMESRFPLPEGMLQGSENDQVPSPVEDRTRELITALFIIPIRKWKTAQEDANLRKKLRQAVMPEAEEATENALMEVEQEPNLSRAKVNDLIKEAITKETAKLRKELEKLRSQPPKPKQKRDNSPHPKGTRGRRQGASEKEKTGKGQKKGNKKQVRFANGSAAAEDADSATRRSGGVLRKSSYPSSPKKNQNNKRNGKGRKRGSQKQN